MGVVTGGAVVGGVVVTGVTVVGGGVVTTGGSVTGGIGTGTGSSVRITSSVGTVVAGAGAEVVGGLTEPAEGAAGTVEATGAVLEVVEPSPKRSAGVDGSPAKRLPSNVDVVVVTTVTLGRVAMARGPVRAESPEVAALRRTMTTTATPTARRMLDRVVLLLANHHCRIRSCAGGRPKAEFLPMYERRR